MNLILLCGIAMPAAAGPAARTVLVLYGESWLSPGIALFDENLRSATQTGAVQPVEFLAEFLDVGRPHDDHYEDILTNFLRDKYQGRPIDIMVACGPTALKFLLQHRGQFLPASPVVYSVVTPAQLRDLPLPQDVAGVPIDIAPLSNFRLALRLRPQARRLVLVTGASTWDLEFEQQLREAVPRLPSAIQVEHLAGLPMPSLQARLRALPEDAVVFVPSFFQDGSGHSFISRDAVALIAFASPVPVFGPSNTYIGGGIVGGYMLSFETMGRQAGQIVLRLLAGEAPSALNLPAVQPNHYIFDWRQLQRFGIAEKDLPEGSILQFREPTLWEAYRDRVFATLMVLLLQTLLIIALLAERRSRRQADAGLRESEKRMSLAAEATGIGLWFWDIARDDIWAADKTRALYGIPDAEPVTYQRFLAALHPADREPTRQAVEEALAAGKGFQLQYRVFDPSGEIRWVSAFVQVEFGDSGQAASLMGVSLDITTQKLAELEVERNRSELAHIARVGLLGQLSGAITHQLNQPLTAILSNAQAAQRLLGREPVDLEEIRDIFQDIVQEDQRAVEIIRHLRSLFKHSEPQRLPLDLSEVVRETLKLMQSDFLARHTTLAQALTDGLPPVLGDRVQLQQVLLNLIVNACEAMTDNEPDERRLTVCTGLDQAGGGVIVTVADWGNGISPEVRERIFAPFFTTKPQGMGMGLAVSRSIIEAHRGKLKADNNKVRGATFSISLPAEKA